jgi:hypothetical protein
MLVALAGNLFGLRRVLSRTSIIAGGNCGDIVSTAVNVCVSLSSGKQRGSGKVSFRQGCVKRKSDRKQDYRRLD